MRNRRSVNIIFNDSRRNLYMILCIVMVLVLTLTVVYAALSTTLNISGNAEVSAASWDIYFDNISIDSGSVTAIDEPTKVDAHTIDFSVVLSKPGDYYKFTVDVVNGGSIDAMIDSIIKLPELTVEQAKIIKYEITYSDGLPISEKHLLAVDSSEKICVELKYRTDITASDLSTDDITLNLSIKAIYIQVDETYIEKPKFVRVVSGDLTTVGSELAIGNEHFYLVSSDSSNVTMLAKYNLHVGNYCTASDNCVAYGADATGIQDSLMVGRYADDSYPRYGTTAFSSDEKKGTHYCTYDGSIVEEYVNNYRDYLVSGGVSVLEARLINKDEINALGCSFSQSGGTSNTCLGAPSWVYSTSYWTETCIVTNGPLVIFSKGVPTRGMYYSTYSYGVRPIIVIPIDEFQ